MFVGKIRKGFGYYTASSEALRFWHAGITEPVATGVDAGLRMGLGKQEQDSIYTDADGVQRRRLEVELQAEEDDERKARRQVRSAAYFLCA